MSDYLHLLVQRLDELARTTLGYNNTMSLNRRASAAAKAMVRKSKISLGAKSAETPTTYEICRAHWKKARLQGCGCHHCMENLYHKQALQDHRRPFHPMKGLSPGCNDAWHLAEIAVKWITATTEMKTARSLARWAQWDSRFPCKGMGKIFTKPAHETLDDEALAEAADIFNELFFAGQLPSSRVKVHWSSLSKDLLGVTNWSNDRTSLILINKDFDFKSMTRRLVLAVVLHEMVHAYLGQFTCYPWSKVTCAKGMCGKLYIANYGLSGHGRAFHHIAKTIENEMGSILGFTAWLGRDDGCGTERNAGGPRPCLKDTRQLYEWMAKTQAIARSRDDDDILNARSKAGQRSHMWMPIKLLCQRTGTTKRRNSC